MPERKKKIKKVNLCRSLLGLFLILLTAFVSVLLLNLFVTKNVKNDDAKDQQATVIGWGGKSVYLRDVQPKIDGFSYTLGNPLYLVPSGTEVSVKESSELPNNEIWYHVEISSKKLQIVNDEDKTIKVIKAEGWVAGKTRAGESIELTKKSIPSKDFSGLENVFWKGFWMIFGSLIGTLVWKVISTKSFDESKWSVGILIFEASVYCLSLSALIYVSFSGAGIGADVVSSASLPMQSEVLKTLNDLLTVFLRSNLGAGLVGFLTCLFSARILSVSHEFDNLKMTP